MRAIFTLGLVGALLGCSSSSEPPSSGAGGSDGGGTSTAGASGSGSTMAGAGMGIAGSAAGGAAGQAATGGSAGMPASGGAGMAGTGGQPSGGVAGASGAGGGGADTWETYAKGFMQTYCVSCHNDDNEGDSTRDYHLLDVVKMEGDEIACGLAKSQEDWTARGCSGFPPARQFPVGNGPKPEDADRDRLIAWIEAGAP